MVTSPPNHKNHAFFSYARKDGGSIASKAKKLLCDGGIEIWIDNEARSPSNMPFGTLIQQALDQSFAVIALVTPGALDSHWVKCEWYYAISKQVPVIPVLAPDFDERMFPFELYSLPTRFVLSTDDAEFEESLIKIRALLEMAREDHKTRVR